MRLDRGRVIKHKNHRRVKAMQRFDSTPPKTGGMGTTLLLWLLCAILILAVFAVAVDSLVPKIESDLRTRSALALSGTGITADNIDVDGLDVVLKGDIDSQPLRDEAGKIVESVTGVRAVQNRLSLGDGNSQPTAGNNAAGSETAPSSQTSVPALPNSANLDIAVDGEQVTVRGTLSSEADIERVSSALGGKFGAANIDSQLEVDAAAAPIWLDSAIAMIDQFDNIQNPGLLISDGKVRLSGDVSSETLGGQKVALASRLFGDAVDIQSNLSIRQPSANASLSAKPNVVANKRPGSLKLANRDGRQILSGVVSSQDELGSIIKAAQDIYQPNALEIAIKVDESVQPIDWADKLFTAANDLGDVDNLGLSVNSGQLVLSGDVASREIAEAAKDSVRQTMDGSLDVIDTFTVVAGLPADDTRETSDPESSATLESGIAAGTGTTPTPQAVAQADGDEETQSRMLAARLAEIDLAQIRFQRGSSRLTEDAKSALDSVADAILDYAKPAVEIAGHTDSVGDAFTNLELSKQRADAVREYLIARSVPAARIRAIGYGETKPVGDNGTPEGRATNRRIEINL
jgi:outer membrane protein OmpA-like peptidoglycan-associated protein